MTLSDVITLPETVKMMENYYSLLFTSYLVMLLLLWENNKNFEIGAVIFFEKNPVNIIY